MSLFIEVIEWREETGQELVHRFEPGGEIKLGAQLVVTENQWAMFFKDGRALDLFETGRHVLSTKNIPLLIELTKLPYGGTSPYRADVYFVAKKTFLDLKWGTRDPVVFKDPQFDMVRLRAHGRYAVKVAEPRRLVNTLVGTLGRFTTADIEDYLREVVVARLNDALGDLAIPLLELPRMYDEVAVELRERVAADFAGLGLELQNLVVTAITPPDEVSKVIDERSGMAAVGLQGNYLAYKAARAMGDAAQGAGDGAGAGAAAGMGVGVGAGLGMAVPGMMREALAAGTRPGAAAPAPGGAPVPPVPPGATTGSFCAACGAATPAGARFCPGCGRALGAAACGRCHAPLPAGARFCPQCGAPTGA